MGTRTKEDRNTRPSPCLLFAPLPSPRAKGKIKAAAGKIDQCGETPRLKAFPFRGWRAERKGSATFKTLLPLAANQ